MGLPVYNRSFTPSKSNARCWRGVGRVIFSNLAVSAESASSTVFLVMVARSESSSNSRRLRKPAFDGVL